jgi:hypothetical protein
MIWNKLEKHGALAKGVMLFIVITTICISALYQYKETEAILYRTDTNTFWRPLQTAGEWLRENSPSDAVVAGEEAGIVPFTSRRHFIDMLGIVDPQIARMKKGLHQKYDAAYVLSREPDYILLHITKDTGEGVYDSSRDMLARAEFHHDFEEAHRITIGHPKYKDKPEHYNDLVIYKKRETTE